MNVIWDMIKDLATIAGLIWAIYAFIKWLRKLIEQYKLKSFKGIWHEYHWTNADGPNKKFRWLESDLTAKPGFLKSYKLYYKNNGEMFYGDARYIDKKDIALNGDILFKVQQQNTYSNSRGTVYFRYNIPELQIGNNDAIAGIWLSYNFGKDITSGASILSKNRIQLGELDAKFNEYFEVNNASIVVKSNNVIGSEPSFFRKLLYSLR